MPRVGLKRLRANADFEANDQWLAGKVWTGRRPRWFISRCRSLGPHGPFTTRRVLVVTMRGVRDWVDVVHLNPLTEEASALLAACRLTRL
jgi:hypothetical protein